MGDLSMIKGKVVLVPFPFDDLSATKVRPAVCLTEPIGQHHHVILAFISSQVSSELLQTDIFLDPKHSDFVTTGLRVLSIIKLHRIMTISTDLIQRELGELSPRLLVEVTKKLKLLFGIH
jgi:mRNA interferase MazF